MNAVSDHAVFARATMPAHFRPNRVERVFDLHPALHVALFGGFFAYLGIMWAAFGNPELAIPFTIFVVFLAAAFIVPACWARVAEGQGPKQSFAAFLEEGFACQTGRIGAGAAMVQVLIMPAMLVIWGLAVAIIAATV